MGSLVMRHGALQGLLNRRLEIALKAGAEEGALIVRENLRRGTRSGVKYPSLPARSSAPGEYPQRQSGALRSRIKAIKRAPLSFGFGSVGATKYDFKLEFGPGERRWLSRSIEDPAARARIARAMIEKARIR